MPVDIQSFAIKVVSGTTAAVISCTIGAPIERIQVILQTQAASTQISTASRYKGIIDCFRRIPKEQGFISLWRGNLANILMGQTKALGFVFNDVYRNIFLGGLDKNTPPLHFLVRRLAAGGAAGGTALLFAYPFQFIHTRLAADVGGTAETRQFSGIKNCFTTILKKDGVRGLYRGFFASVQGTIVHRGFYFGVYDAVRSMLPAPINNSIGLVTSFGVAQIVTMGAGAVSYPFYTVTRHLMMQSGRRREDVMYTGIMDCWKKLYKNEGVIGFYRGFLINILRGIGGPVLLVSYDQLRSNY